MNLVNFADPSLAARLVRDISERAKALSRVTLMEVCGTHTMEIGRLSLRQLMPPNVHLTSGPGCPVCVTPGSAIDAAARLTLEKRVTVLSFGDMLRVPGNETSLEEAQTEGGSVDVVASPLQALAMATDRPEREFVFIAVGFETTIPVVARAVTLADERRITNLSFLVSHRLVPPALAALASDPEVRISGLLLPGHVSAVIGLEPYVAIRRDRLPAAVTGFEPLDILAGIDSVVGMLAEGAFRVTNMYPRVVRPEGNPNAQALIDKVFEPVDAMWRGMGMIPRSGLRLRGPYRAFDAAQRYGIDIHDDRMPTGCACGKVLRGVIAPSACPLFGSRCTPQSPVGPCMVSSEGSCAAYYRYGA